MKRSRPAKISLLLADVDGTLVTHEKVLTDRAVAAVNALRDAGIRFAVTSGRPPKGMGMLIEPLKIDTPIAAFNGGLFVNPDFSVIEGHTLPRNVGEVTVDLMQSHDLDVWLYKGSDWFIRDPKAPHVEREEWTVKFPPTIVRSFDGLLGQDAKIVGVSDDLERVKACEAACQQQLARLASAARSQPYYLDVTHPAANKGGVVDYLSRTLGIPAGEIATIGDMPNDILMFEKGGLAIAMGNGGPEVQDAADVVTDSCDDEGFANAVHNFILRG
ncbi:hypothetical protein FHS85_004709 [Rhodoligotrophos appendicifer]|uniref:Cof-type HAD-IIB family hydrolase n=1 Tax=Rhodoligotrophos appendicifer TaxID=987056 RepID=UPI001186DB6B|nr:Cof-type HAD-IIB family hydrolase [Rhodoligotrophos appendicifer]